MIDGDIYIDCSSKLERMKRFIKRIESEIAKFIMDNLLSWIYPVAQFTTIDSIVYTL